ncbi:PqqD family protein [Sphingomonas sp.]|jgi:hypothetical protein|uniref:PqqD family protein n=1 Tax=Sphingomonas sp. TaxID=28214 RepID=UPI003BAB3051
MQVTLETRLVRSEDVMHVSVGDDETVMMSIAGGYYYGLNPVATWIWRLLEKPQALSDVCNSLIEEFEVDRPACEKEVLQFAQQLVDHQIVGPAD